MILELAPFMQTGLSDGRLLVLACILHPADAIGCYGHFDTNLIIIILPVCNTSYCDYLTKLNTYARIFDDNNRLKRLISLTLISVKSCSHENEDREKKGERATVLLRLRRISNIFLRSTKPSLGRA